MAGVGIWIIVGLVSVSGIETPEYTVIVEKDGYEVREYSPRIVAEVTMNKAYRAALNGGFRQLADYIFGNNATSAGDDKSEKIEMTAPVLEQEKDSEKIAMTAPVLEQEEANEETESHVIAFVMPKKYTIETLPKPNSPDVRIVELPAKQYAVLSFSGFVPEKKAAEKKAQLRELLDRDDIDALGEPLLAQYNPPWTPPFMRKNEVWIEVEFVEGTKTSDEKS